jgi:hypothetical protein
MALVLFASPTAALALDKPRLTVSGRDVASINVAEAEAQSFTADVVLPKPDAGVTKWNVVAFDFETQSIVWSQSSDGTPPDHVAWNYRQKDGKLPRAGAQLGLRATYVTSGGPVASPVAAFSVTARHALFLDVRKKDVLFQPRGAIGYQRITMQTKSGAILALPFFPIVSSDVGLRLYQSINLRLALDSGNDGISRFTPGSFAGLTGDASYTLLGDERGEGSGLAVGAKMIALKAALPDKQSGQLYSSAFRGGAAGLSGWLEIAGGLGIEASAAAGAGLGRAKVLLGELGPRVGVTENVDLLVLLRGVGITEGPGAAQGLARTEYAQAMFYLELAL